MARICPHFAPSSLALATLVVALGAATALGACHRNRYPDVALPPFPSGSAARSELPPPGVLFREEVDATLEAGLGYFLQQVAVEPHLADGAFVGWQIRDLLPAEAWASVDLRPGDVVTSVNGLPIETDQQAFEAFQGMKKASELRVTYLRDGEARELTFRVVPKGSAGASPRAAGRGASSAATVPPASASAPATPGASNAAASSSAAPATAPRP